MTALNLFISFTSSPHLSSCYDQLISLTFVISFTNLKHIIDYKLYIVILLTEKVFTSSFYLVLSSEALA